MLISNTLSGKYLHVKILDVKVLGSSLTIMDIIDRMNEKWREVRPDLDPGPLEVVGRVLVLAQYLERSVNEALAKHELSLGQFDILATMRRRGKLTPTQLMESVMLSSGGMTNRLDRLEEAGLIRREADLEDRRGVVVGLTRKGKELIDLATESRFAEAKSSLSPLGVREVRELSSLLRTWVEHAEGKQIKEL